MSIRTNIRSFVVYMLALALLALSAGTAFAAEAAGTGKAEVRVKAGSGQMKINGSAVTIQAPYTASGLLMVPLSVFTNAKGFGAKVKLSNNKVITLTYLKATFVLTKGSKSATLNGKKLALPVAPLDKKGVTMVPMAVVAKSLGIAVATDAKTKEIVLTGAASAGGAAPGIDADAGKSLIGDSYYKWSMNYPTGLVQGEQRYHGSQITFADVKGDYYMAVAVDEAPDELASDEKRALLEEQYDGETLVDVKTVNAASGSYERATTKDSGFYYEYRGYQANGNFYILIFGKKAKAASELGANAALLDSFRTSFNAANKSLKDLSIVKDGKITYTNKEYGTTVQLPVEWDEDEYEDYPSYTGPNDEALTLEVNSLLAGDTLETIQKRDQKAYESAIAEDYRTASEVSSITWNGIPAILGKYSFTMDKKTWMDSYRIYAVKGDYKYVAAFQYERKYEDKAKPVLDHMISGMKVDFAAVTKWMGQVPDPDDTEDLESTMTRTSAAYGYKITVPKHWVEGVLDVERDLVQIEAEGTHFTVATETGDNLEIYASQLDDTYTDAGGLKQTSKTNVSFAGVPAIKLEYETTEIATIKGKVTTYLFSKDGNIYMIQGMMLDFSATPLAMKQLDDAMNSFVFTE